MKIPPLKISRPNKKAVAGSNAVFSFILLVIIVILTGIILQNISRARIDISEDKLSSLSPASQNIASRLEDPATVTLYFTEDLPTNLQVVKRNILDTLESYRSASNGNLSIELIDPTKNNEALAKAKELGINERQFNVYSAEKVSFQIGYMGLSLSYKTRDDFIIPFIPNTSSFEYDFSSLLKKALDQDLPARKVYFLAGHGELDAGSMTAVRRALNENAVVSDLDLTEQITVPEDTSTLVIAGATETIPPEQLQAIDQYIMNGGKALILIDSINVTDNLEATKINSGVETMLMSYGVKVGSNVVGDRSSGELMPFNDGYQVFLQQYPYLLRVIKENINSESPIVRDIDSLLLFWPTEVSTSNVPTGVQIDKLFSTSTEGGFVASEPANLMPLRGPNDTYTASSEGKIDLGLTVSGAIPSAYNSARDGNESPDPESSGSTTTSTGGRLVVVGDADIIRDDIIQRYQGNGVFIMNAIDWLLQDEDLIQIRSKSANSRSLEPMEDSTKASWKWANLLIPPLLILAGGIVAWRLRRRS